MSRMVSTSLELMNRFTYDNIYQLATNTFGLYSTSTSAFTARNEYRTWGGRSGDSITYDLNGNITKMHRNGYNNSGDTLMDNLNYTYTSLTNKLAAVRDSAVAGTYSTDFDAAAVKNFTYNNLGQLTASEAENISSVTYTATGQVSAVTYTNGDAAEYFYNERGVKIRSRHKPSGGTVKNTWYITDASGAIMAIHEQDSAQSPYNIQLKEQPVYAMGRIGTYEKANDRVVYEIHDHVGNVRATFYDNAGTTALLSWADFYPHGGVMPGRNESTYRYNYQSQESEAGNTNRWQNFELRMHNPDLGRWMTPDPMGQFHSPYLSMGNNPVSMVDPSGGYATAGMTPLSLAHPGEYMDAVIRANKLEDRRKAYLRGKDASFVDNKYGSMNGYGSWLTNPDAYLSTVYSVIDQMADIDMGTYKEGMGPRDDFEFQSFLARSEATYQMHNTLRAIDASGDMTREQKDYAKSHERYRTRRFIEFGIDVDNITNSRNGTLASGHANIVNFAETQMAGAKWAASRAGNKKRVIHKKHENRAPKSISTKTFTGLDNESYIVFEMLGNSDKVEILVDGDVVYTAKDAKYMDGDAGEGYFKHGHTIHMSAVYSEIATTPTTIQIRVTGNPSLPTIWDYWIHGSDNLSEITNSTNNVPQIRSYDFWNPEKRRR